MGRSKVEAEPKQNLALALEICRKLMSSLELEEVLEQLADYVESLIKVDCITIGVIENSKIIADKQRGPGQVANYSPLIPLYRMGKGLSGKAYQTGKIALTSDYFNDNSFEHEPAIDAEMQRIGIQASLAAPILLEDKVTAMFWASQSRPYQWTKQDLEFVEHFTQLASLAIQNAQTHADSTRLNKELASRNQEFEALHEFNRRLRGPTQLKDMLARALDLVQEAIEIDSGALYLLSFDNDKNKDDLDLLQLAASIEVSWDKFEKYGLFKNISEVPKWSTTVELGKGFIGRAAQTRQTIIVENLLPLTQDNPDITRTLAKWRSGLFTPLIIEGKLIGVLGLVAIPPGQFLPEQVRFVEMMTGQIAAAVNQVLHLKVEQEREQLRAVLALARKVAHDLNQPLTVIQAELDFVLQMGDTPTFEVLLRLQEAVSEISNLVREYQKIAQIKFSEPIPGISVIDI